MAPATVATAVTAPGVVHVLFAAQTDEGDQGTETTTSTEKAPNPILPIGKEIAWGFGSFLVLFVLMRYWLFPRIKKGMDARAQRVRTDLATAEQVTAQAEAEVADYERQVHAIRVEAHTRVEAARATLDAERQARLAEVTGRLNERRARAAEDTEAARRAALGHIAEAVADVAGSAATRVLGRPADPATVRRVADEVVGAGAGEAGVAR